MTNDLSHLDDQNRPRMVDVTDKPESHRVAKATGFIRLQPNTCSRIADNSIAKGSVLMTAELAGVQAAKKTPDLIPLCHNLLLTKVGVEAILEDNGVRVASTVKCTGQTGVEMEALTAVSIALLTVYDMCKAIDKEMTVTEVRLIEKTKEPVA